MAIPSAGGAQLNPQNMAMQGNQNQGQGVSMQTNQMENSQAGVGMQTNQMENSQAGAPGVPSGTDPTQQGWTYGSNPGGPVQGQINNPTLNTAAINPTQMPVSQINQGKPYMQNMEDAYYQQGARRLDPQMQQQQAGLENQLAQMGLTRGSEAWNAEMQRQAFNSNDAYANLRNQATLNSGSEAARMQGMDINAGNFANNAAQQNFMNQGQSQQWQNAAQGQQFGQNLQAGQFGNQAQQQQWAQGNANDQLRNAAMASQGNLANQRQSNANTRFGLENQFSLGQEQNRLTGVGQQNQYELGQAQNATNRYGIDTGAATSRYGADQGLAAAGLSANAQMAGYNTQQQIANQRFGLDQQQQDWNQYRQGMALPYELQNLQMQGMSPTGPAAQGQYGQTGVPSGGGQYNAALGQSAANNNYGQALGNMGGALYNAYRAW